MYAVADENLEKRYQLTDYPLNIAIEVTNHCNLNCVMCKNNMLTRSKGFMSIPVYKKIIDETARENRNTRIWLDFYGEALLAGWKLYFMIDYAKKKGLTNVCINTNGTLMKREYADMLLDAGVDYISLDCDGFSKEVYESIRLNADRDEFYANVEYLLEEKKRRNSNVVVDIKVIEMAQNRSEIDQIVAYWKARGAWTAVRRCSEWVDDMTTDTFDNTDRIACGHGIGTAAITWDAKVASCVWDYDLELSCGNILEESLKKIWQRRNREFLSLHVHHQWTELPDFCKNCSNWRNVGEQRQDENGQNVNRQYGMKAKIF